MLLSSYRHTRHILAIHMSMTYHSCRTRVQFLSYSEYNLPDILSSLEYNLPGHSCRIQNITYQAFLSYLEYNLPGHSCRIWNITYQDILVVLPGHEDQPLALYQLSVVDQAQALGGILSVGLNKGTLSWDFLNIFWSICEGDTLTRFLKYFLIYLWKGTLSLDF